MRHYSYLLSCLPLLAFAAQANAATPALPDVEVNLDVLTSSPAQAPAPVAFAPSPALPAVPSAPSPLVTAVPVAESAPEAPVSAPAAPVVESVAALAPVPVKEPTTGYVQAGGNYSSLSDGLGTWNGQYVKGEIQGDKDNRWNGEVVHQREFGQQGYFASVGNTHTFNEDWYSAVGVGAGSAAADFFPKFRADGTINRKLLDNRHLIASLGLGYIKYREVYSDNSLYGGLTYYFDAPWIVQAGLRYNNSNPGSVKSISNVLAVTQGYNKNYFLTAAYGFSQEAYQIRGNLPTLSDFNSQLYTLDLRKWLTDDLGFDVRGEHYHSPSYDRDGVNFGVFKEF